MSDLLHGGTALLIYFAIAASTALVSRALITIPDELFRKILHFILLGSLLVFVFAFDVWWISALSSLAFAIVVYPLLALAEHIKGFSRLTTERKAGELKHSLLLVFSMFALVISICWGWLGDRWLAVISVYAWGFGDAAAENSDKGNVIPGLSIAILGVIANTIFWRRYAKLNRAEPNAILAVQARLYRAKSLVDCCVTISLLSVALAPETMLSYWLDTIGSVIVAAYLVFCGVQTIRERIKQ